MDLDQALAKIAALESELEAAQDVLSQVKESHAAEVRAIKAGHEAEIKETQLPNYWKPLFETLERRTIAAEVEHGYLASGGNPEMLELVMGSVENGDVTDSTEYLAKLKSGDLGKLLYGANTVRRQTNAKDQEQGQTPYQIISKGTQTQGTYKAPAIARPSFKPGEEAEFKLRHNMTDAQLRAAIQRGSVVIEQV